MSTKRSVAILGGTGLLGYYISDTFLREFKQYFPDVRVITRDLSSLKAQELAAKGAALYKLEEADLAKSFDKAFAGVDVVVDTLSTEMVPAETTAAVLEAAARSSAKVYFLSEWGIDHRTTDFGGDDLHTTLAKRTTAAKARTLMKDKKVIAVYTSAFLEIVFRPGRFNWFKVPSDTIECIGPATQRITFTSMTDIGRSTARLALLALDPNTTTQVPDELRIAGTTVTVKDIRDLIARYTGKKAEIKVHDLIAAREQLRANPRKDLFLYLGIAAGEGKIDFSENDNELLNPGQSVWKWITVDDELKKVCSVESATLTA